MLREWQVTYKEQLAEVKAAEKRAKLRVETRGKTRAAIARARAKATNTAKKAQDKIERPSVTGIYRRHLQHIPNVIQVRTFRAWVGKGYRFAALAGGGKSDL